MGTCCSFDFEAVKAVVFLANAFAGESRWFLPVFSWYLHRLAQIESRCFSSTSSYLYLYHLPREKPVSISAMDLCKRRTRFSTYFEGSTFLESRRAQYSRSKLLRHGLFYCQSGRRSSDFLHRTREKCICMSFDLLRNTMSKSLGPLA